MVGCGLAIRDVLDDGGAIRVPQGALDLFEQIDDGLGLPRAQCRHGEGDDTRWGRRFHDATGAEGVRSEGPSMVMVWQRSRRRSSSASTIFLLPRNSYQAS